MNRTVAGRWLLVAGFLAFPGGVLAQRTGEAPRQLVGTGLDERLGEVVPAHLTFVNEVGQEVTLERYFDGERPVLLTLVYHDCPMLCSLVLHGLTKALGEMSWVPGDEFEIVTASFNPAETPAMAAEAKNRHVEMLGKERAAEGWHFLTGSEASIEALTSSVGFRYRWIEEQKAFAHPSALIFLDGSGTVSRYLHGVEYDPRDLRTALVEASNGQVGSPIDQVILYCFQYDSSANSYVLHARNLMKLGGLLTVVLLGSMLFVYWRRESRRSNAQAAA